ncbi:bZIP transcription factor [Colletotrichum musicola]|uniref:BZIP transcription factor n=1 Tax=Colletotrichum musicola TaxID=2175873 RepID=A0A8H6KQS2_9PEZI|nr:bZIP transcription factor [Colletotrichum musicola]
MGGTPVPAPTPEARSQTVSSSRLKKREADRKAQRIAREKTKNRIAQLEKLVAELSRRDDNAATVSLMAQLSRVTEQKNKLVGCLEATAAGIARHLVEIKEGETEEPTGAPAQAKTDVPDASDPRLNDLPLLAPAPVSTTADPVDAKPLEQNDAYAESLLNESMSIDDFLTDAILPPELTIPSNPSPLPTTLDLATLNPVSNATPPACSCSKSTRTRRLSDGSLVDRNNWKAGNEILREPFPASEAMPDAEREAGEDVPVRAILHGWDSLTRSGRMTPLWRRARRLDELCFSGCGQAERLAVLSMVHLLMRAYADSAPGEVVPRWYLKSQLQEISHDPSADYFTWPAVRLRFATNPHRYCDNKFWHLFREHIRIAWPSDFRDCYVRNVRLGAYGLSPLFRDRLRDLRAWTMEPDFFVHFPELRQDIPQFPGQPSPVSIFNPAADGGFGQRVRGQILPIGDVSSPVTGIVEDQDREQTYQTRRGLCAGGSIGGFDGEMMNDLDLDMSPELFFFQDTFLSMGARQVEKHKDSSCISL